MVSGRSFPRVASRLAGLLLAALAAAGCSGRERLRMDPDAVPDAYAVPTGALMTPGSTRAWHVTGDGHLFNGAWRLRIAPISGADTAGPPRRIAAEDRWVPVLHWARSSGAVRWEFSAAALADRAPRDSQLIASIEVVARNTGAAPAPARLELTLVGGEPGAPFAAWDATPEPPRWGTQSGTDLVHGWCEEPGVQPRMSPPAGIAGGSRGSQLAQEWPLAPGEARTFRVVLPAYPSRSRDLHRFAGRSHRACEARVRRDWRRALAKGAAFDLGDPEVEDALAAASVVLLACRERRGERWVPIGGPFQYRDVWLRDGARAIAALSVAGHTKVARELAEGFLLLRWPNGAFLSQRGQLDGTGQALWAFEQAMLRPAPKAADLAAFAEAAGGAVRWLALQRELGANLEGNFPTMLPFAEPRDGELTRAQLVGNDAWTIAGLRSAARLLAAAGLADEARGVAELRQRHVAEFDSALARTGHPDLPPSWQGAGRDWGAYAVAWPCGALPPGSPRVARFAARIWSAAGGAGLAFYSHPDSLHGYLGADLGVAAMLAGRRGEADSVLAAHLRWRTASGTAGELFDRQGRYGGNLPPHPTSASALWLLVRNAVIHDDDDTLRLTMGARERWWRGSRIERAPTRWGALRLEFRREAAMARWSWTPVEVWTALTLPPGSRLAEAPAAPLRGERGGNRIWAPPGTRQVEARLAPEAAS